MTVVGTTTEASLRFDATEPVQSGTPGGPGLRAGAAFFGSRSDLLACRPPLLFLPGIGLEPKKPYIGSGPCVPRESGLLA